MENKKYINFKITDSNISKVFEKTLIIVVDNIKFFTSKKAVKYFENTKLLTLSIREDYEYSLIKSPEEIVKISGTELLELLKDKLQLTIKPIDITQFK
jgi:hypothetical protein